MKSSRFIETADHRNPQRSRCSADIALIKSVLDGEGIHCFFQGENVAHLLAQPAMLMVGKDDVARAKEIITELNLGYRFFS